MAERKIVRTWTPGGWLEYFVPTLEAYHIPDGPPMTEQEQLDAALRYVRSRYGTADLSRFIGR